MSLLGCFLKQSDSLLIILLLKRCYPLVIQLIQLIPQFISHSLSLRLSYHSLRLGLRRCLRFWLFAIFTERHKDRSSSRRTPCGVSRFGFRRISFLFVSAKNIK